MPLAFRPLTLKTTDQRPDISECVLMYISRKRIQNFRVRLIDKMGRNMVYLIKMFPYITVINIGDVIL